ncbi:MAG: polyprenol monophosphomannose synthase [bacterium]
MSDNRSIYIIIPCYNEADNIGLLILKIKQILPSVMIIVVDDNSPDGTAEIVKDIMTYDKSVSLILREGKGGRGSASIEGMREALKKGADIIIEMDADFSHSPSELPSIIGALERYDMVIGSRYLPSSRIKGWPLMRRFFSKLANIYARFMLGIPITDYTNGYRAYKREVLSAVDFEVINRKGYVVLSEMAMNIFTKGFKIGEIATYFLNRRRGLSNLSMNEIISAFTSVIDLRRRYIGLL